MRPIIYFFFFFIPCCCFAQDWEQQYQRSYEKGNFQKATTIALQQVDSTKEVLSYILAAQASIIVEDFIVAEKYLKKAKQQISTDSTYQGRWDYTLGYLYYKKEDYKKAAFFLQKSLAVASTKNSTEVLLLLANLYGSSNKYATAKLFLNRLVTIIFN